MLAIHAAASKETFTDPDDEFVSQQIFHGTAFSLALPTSKAHAITQVLCIVGRWRQDARTRLGRVASMVLGLT
jgi:hypothetical protein